MIITKYITELKDGKSELEQYDNKNKDKKYLCYVKLCKL